MPTTCSLMSRDARGRAGTRQKCLAQHLGAALVPQQPLLRRSTVSPTRSGVAPGTWQRFLRARPSGISSCAERAAILASSTALTVSRSSTLSASPRTSCRPLSAAATRACSQAARCERLWTPSDPAPGGGHKFTVRRTTFSSPAYRRDHAGGPSREGPTGFDFLPTRRGLLPRLVHRHPGHRGQRGGHDRATSRPPLEVPH